ncbi:hypothetical protein FXO38_08530 [Capsicum annuum]|nr:hypothetical protein FXO38_08530 [Capsicum annuum]
MTSGHGNEQWRSSSSRGKNTTKSKVKQITSRSSPSHSLVPPLHPPSQGSSPFSHSFYGTLLQGCNSILPQGYSSMPPLGFSSMPSQDYGMSSSTPFYNMPTPDRSSVPPSLIRTHGTHSSCLAAMDRRPPSDTTLSKSIQPVSPQLSRSNIGASNSEMCNSEASPNPSSTPSSVHGPDLPPPGELDQLRRVRIIADGDGFYPSRLAANAISAGIQKLYDGFYPSWGEVSDRTKQGVLNEFMKICTWSLCEDRIIQSNFKKASSLLSCMPSKARSNGQRPGWLGSDYWDKLIVYWQSSEFQKKSNQTKAARKFKKGGSLHTCGSVSMGTAKRKLEASLGRPATREELWKKTHMKIRDGKEVWVETRAEDTFWELARKYEEERKRRMDEERRRMTLESDVQELKAQVNTLIKLPRSPHPSSNDDGEEDEDDGEDELDY